jgi:ribosomal protein S27AE
MKELENLFLNEKNKLVTKVKDTCPRCSGVGIIVARVENGKMIPIPVDGGICYLCEGRKYIEKTVRLYTDEEFEQMEKAKAKAAEKRAAAQEKKMKEEFAENHVKWLDKNGFNENEETFIYFPDDSYSVKNEL